MSSADIERRAENVRAEIANTADSIRSRLTPGPLVDEAINYVRYSDGALSLDNLRRQARDNPMALAVIGAGLAWLILGNSHASRTSSREEADYYPQSGGTVGDYPAPPLDPAEESMGAGEFGYADETQFSGSPTERLEESQYPGSGEQRETDRTSSRASSAADAVSRTAERARSSAEALGAGARETWGEAARTISDVGRGARSAGSRVSGHFAHAAQDLRNRSGHAADRARQSFSDLLDREPLIIGALSLAVGAAIGAMLPRTRMENEYLGAVSDQAKRSASEMAKKGMDEAKDVAKKGFAAAKSAMREEHLLPEKDEKPLAEKVERVAKSASETVEGEARKKL
jgi:hypothetical protein